jgi:hypothetical protein
MALIKDRAEEALNIGKYFGLPQIWSSFMAKILLSDQFRAGVEELRMKSETNPRHSITEWTEPFKVIAPYQIKAVMICKEPIATNSAGYPWITQTGKLRAVYSNSMTEVYDLMELQSIRKYSGTDYVRHLKNAEKFSGEVYRLALERVKNELSLTGTVKKNDKPFETYNWYKQGLFMVNANQFRGKMRPFLDHMLSGLVNQRDMVFATYNENIYTEYVTFFPELIKIENPMSCLIRINNAIEGQRGSKHLIDYTI